MVLIHARDPALLARIAAAVPEPRSVAKSWRNALSEAGGASVCILGIVSYADRLPENVAELRHRTSAPIVLVAPLTTDAAVLGTFIVDQVLWAGEVRERLPFVVRQFLRQRLQHRFADAIRRCDQIPQDIRERLATLCEMDPPPTTVSDACRVLLLSPPVACRLLHRYFNLPAGYATGGMLEWLRLLCMCDPMYQPRKQHLVALHVGRSVRAMQLVSQRRTGRTLKQLRDDPYGLLSHALATFSLCSAQIEAFRPEPAARVTRKMESS